MTSHSNPNAQNTKTFILEDIDKKSAEEITMFINKYSEENINIIINSHGGSTYYEQIISTILDLNKSRINLIAVNYIKSSALDLFFNFKGKKTITKNTIGMYHLTTYTIDTLSNKKIKPYHKFSFNKERKTDLKYTIQFAKEIGFNKKEMKKLTSGKDVNLDYKRMKKLLKKSMARKND